MNRQPRRRRPPLLEVSSSPWTIFLSHLLLLLWLTLSIGHYDLVVVHGQLLIPAGGLSLALPDFEMPIDVLGMTATIVAQNITCENITVGDVEVGWNVVGPAATSLLAAATTTTTTTNDTSSYVRLLVTELVASCTFDYRYSSLLGENAGRAVLRTNHNTIRVAYHQTTTTTTMEEQMESCVATVNITAVDFLTNEPLATVFTSFLLSGSGSDNNNATTTPSLLVGEGVPSMGDLFGDAICGSLAEPSALLGSFLSSGDDDDGEEDDDEKITVFGLLGDFAKADVMAAEREFLTLENSYASSSSSSSTRRQLVDYQGATEWPGTGARWLLDLASVLNSTDQVAGGPFANELLRALFQDDNGILTWNTTLTFVGQPPQDDNATTALVSSTLTIHQIQVSGLDEFTNFGGIRPVGRHTLALDVALTDLVITALGSVVTMTTSPLGPTATAVNVSVSANVSTLDGVFAVFLPLDETILGNIPLAALMDAGTAAACLQSTVVDFRIADTQIRSLRFSPSTSPDWNVINGAGIEFNLQSLFNNDNNNNDASGGGGGGNSSTPAQCGRPNYFNANSAFVDFRDLLLPPDEARLYGTEGLAPYGSAMSTAKSFLEDSIAQISTSDDDSSSSVLKLNGPFILARGTPNDIGSISLVLDALALDLIPFSATEEPFRILEPQMNQSATLSNLISASTLTVLGSYGLRYNDLALDDEWSFKFRSDSTSISLQTLTYMFEQSFLDFPLKSWLNLNCWMATIPQAIDQDVLLFAIERLSVDVGVFDVSLRCKKCHETAAESIDFALDPSERLQDWFNEFLLQVFVGGPTEVKPFLERSFKEAPKRCPHMPTFDPSFQERQYQLAEPRELSRNSFYIVALLILVVIFLALVVWYHVLQPAAIRRGRQQQGRRAVEPRAATGEGEDHLGSANPRRRNFDEDSSSLFRRSLIAAMVLLSCLLFILGSTLTTLLFRIHFDVAERHLMALDINYSIMKLAREFWVGEGYMFAILIVVCSLFIPLMRNACILLIELTPMDSVYLQKTQVILRCLNFIGKWVIGTFFVLVISTTCLSIVVKLPFTTTTGQDVIQMRGFMTPVYGLFFWVVGQLIAQWCGEIVLRRNSTPQQVIGGTMCQTYSKGLAMTMSTTTADYGPHSSPGQPATPTGAATTEPEECTTSLAHRTYSRRLSTRVEQLQVPLVTNVGIVLASVSFFVLLGLGIFRPYIGFRHDGLVTLHFSDDDDDARPTEFSIASTVRAFASNARFSGTPTIHLAAFLLSTLLLAFVVILPAAEYACLLYLWFGTFGGASASNSFFSKCKSAAEWCRIFAYAEVFVLSVVIATYQITMVVQFLIGTNCEAASSFIGLAVEFGLIDQADAFCYQVVGQVREGAVCLLAAALLQLALRTLVGEALASSNRPSQHQQEQQQQRLVLVSPTAAAEADDQTTAFTDHDLPTTPVAGTTPPTRTTTTMVPSDDDNDNRITFADRFRLLLCPVSSSS